MSSSGFESTTGTHGPAPHVMFAAPGVSAQPRHYERRPLEAAPPTAIILGFSRGVRHLDPLKSYPRALRRVESGRVALEITLNALADVGLTAPHFVGGYHVEKVLEDFADRVHVSFLADWENRGPAAALQLVSEHLAGELLILDADFIFYPGAFSGPLRTDLFVGVTPTAANAAADCANESATRQSCPLLWIENDRLTAIGDRPSPSAQPCLWQGMIRTTGAGSRSLRSAVERLASRDRHATLTDVLAELLAGGAGIHAGDIGHVSYSLDSDRPLARSLLGTKAETLARLRGVLRTAKILDQYSFSLGEWEDHPERILGEVQEAFAVERLVVRSSSQAEDGWQESSAGKFASVLDVPRRSRDELAAAIRHVAKSYKADGSAAGQDQVLIQPMLDNVVASGVALTRAPVDGGPYVVVNFEESPRTDAVTAGIGQELQTHWVFKSAATPPSSPLVRQVVETVGELETLLEHDRLDVEFAVDAHGQLYVLQVRPLVQATDRLDLDDDDVGAECRLSGAFVTGLFQRHPLLAGKTTVLANMPDWNPAEMIGVCPKPLALSLYQGLITSETWSVARAACGYRDVRPAPLLMSIGGRPYIDVRTSLNSFLPRDLSDDVAEKVVDVAVERLTANPHWHDKLEFDVTATFFPPDFPQAYRFFRMAGLNSAEFLEFGAALARLTDRMIASPLAPMDEQLAAFDELQARRRRVLDACRDHALSAPRAIGLLYEDAKRFGVLPFSILARYGFVALGMLQSLVRLGIFAANEIGVIQNALPTVARAIVMDFEAVRRERLDLDEFLRRHGHLRPSSYDICSPNYHNGVDTYFDFQSPVEDQPATAGHRDEAYARRLFLSRREAIDGALRQSGFTFDADVLWEFVAAAIPGRERGKYEFTKNLDAILELVASHAQTRGFARDEAAFLRIETIVNGSHDSPSPAERTMWSREILLGKKRHWLSQSIKLPPVIRGLDDFSHFQEFAHEANFIGSGTVTAQTVHLDGTHPHPDIEGKIVILENADPGYDWILAHGIAGLVTKFGGVASHMAIRAAEFGFPAAIGCGESLFNRAKSARVLTVDCLARKIVATA